MAPPKKRNRSNENFTKRWRTFAINGLRMHRIFGADVCILLRRHGRHYWFRSAPTLKIPLEEEVMQSYPVPVVITAADAERLERRRRRQPATSAVADSAGGSGGSGGSAGGRTTDRTLQ